MRLVVLVGVLILTGANVSASAESLRGDSKRAIPLAGEEPYDALQRGDYRLAAGLFTHWHNEGMHGLSIT